MESLVGFEIDDEVAVLTLDRPDALNALDYALIDTLMAHLDAIESAPAIRAIVLTGSGERAFSAGADIKEFRGSVDRGQAAAMRDFLSRGQAMTVRLETFPKPIIAAVNGLAFGGGCEIVEAVHLAIAAEQATFAKPEIRLGMPPTFGGTQRLPRLVGRHSALRMLLTGDPIDARRAYELGLVDDVVPLDKLRETAMVLARRISRHSTASVGGVLAAVARGLDPSLPQGLQVEAAQFAELVGTRDLAEGLDAWIERRPPSFAGS